MPGVSCGKRMVASVAFSLCLALFPARAQQLELQPKDRIAIIGNAFADNMRRYGYLETILRSKYPEYDLIFRNMGWSGDTVTLQPRPLNFGTTEDHLKKQAIDVVIACFGMVESFDGVSALDRFEAEFRAYMQRLKSTSFNGRTPPRVLVVSPIYHEDLGRPLPDPAEHNAALERYTEVMARVAKELGLPFVDLYSPTKRLNTHGERTHLTENGIHPTEFGYWYLCQLIASEMSRGGQGVVLDVDVREKRANVRGLEVESVAESRGAIEIRLGPMQLMVPPPPADRLPDVRELSSGLPVVRVRGLKPGKYVLRSGEATIAVADAREWEKGVRVTRLPAQLQAERLRAAVIQKNEYWFHRWRPHNTEYIFGRRRKPFGVVSFPPEMEAWDRLIAEQEQELVRLSQPIGPTKLELVPAE